MPSPGWKRPASQPLKKRFHTGALPLAAEGACTSVGAQLHPFLSPRPASSLHSSYIELVLRSVPTRVHGPAPLGADHSAARVVLSHTTCSHRPSSLATT